jgi:hypothetical protein
MYVPPQKKLEFWNHFIARWAMRVGSGGCHGATGLNLKQAHEKIMWDNEFWEDVVVHHGGLEMTPEEMEKTDREVYHHCLGNFWVRVATLLADMGLTD